MKTTKPKGENRQQLSHTPDEHKHQAILKNTDMDSLQLVLESETLLFFYK
jgi:hypothetical protein